MREKLERLIRRLAASRHGGTAIEYGLILALVVLVMFASLQGLATVTTGMWGNVSTRVQNAH